MKHWQTIVGLFVVAVLAGGVCWVNQRGGQPPGPGAASSGQAVRDDGSLPDVTLAPSTAEEGNVRIALALAPNPPVAFAKMRVRVRVESAGSPVPLDGGRVSFEMTMPMGDYRYTLAAAQDGSYGAEVVLPMCVSGARRWYATVEGAVAGQPRVDRKSVV